MIDPTYIELMNLELDGKASEKQRARLRCHLAESAEAASYFEDLARVVRGLDAEALLEPPSELHARIMTAVDQAAREPAPEGFAAWLARALRFTPARRRVLATFAVGVAAGAFLMASVRFDHAGRIDPSSVSGTMATRVPEAAIVPGPGSGVSGSAEIYTEEGVTVVDVRLEGAGVLEWTLGFDPDLAVSQIEAPAGAGDFSASAGEVHVRQAGRGTCRIVLSGRAEPAETVVLRVVMNGQVVFERAASPLH